MKKLALCFLLLVPAGGAFAAGVTLDYLTTFNGLAGVSWGSGLNTPQVGEVVTVPNGVSSLLGFTLAFFNSNGSAVSGEVQTWNGSTPGTTLYTSSPVSSGDPGISSYQFYTFTPGSPIPVIPGQQILLSLLQVTTVQGNIAYQSSDPYPDGGFVEDFNGAWLTIFSPGDAAFSATFDSAPEPATWSLLPVALILIAARHSRSQRPPRPR